MRILSGDIMGIGMKNGYLKSRNIREVVGNKMVGMVIFWDDHEDFLSGDILPKNKGDLGKKICQREQPPQFMGYIKVCDWTAVLEMLKNGSPSSNVAGETLEQK